MTPTPTATPPAVTRVSPPPAAGAWRAVRDALRPVASLQLTVALFGLSMVLVFFGTVAMMAQGLWSVVDDYFRSFVVWIPVDLVRRFGTVFLNDLAPFPKDASPWPGSFPFPGGWAIGTALLANLVAAHLVRFKLSWKRAGVIVLHAGVGLLMVGELVTGLFAVESTMTLTVGETSDFVDVTREMEIAVTDGSDPKVDTVTVVPQQLFERPGPVALPGLPFDLDVLEYWKNTDMDLLRRAGSEPDTFPVRDGLFVRLARKNEAAGVDTEAHSDIPSARVRVTEKGTGRDLGAFLLSLWGYPNFEQNRRRFELPEQAVEAGGKKYTLGLRNKRVYKPYAVRLERFEHGKYAGTDIPKDFASTVVVSDPAAGDSREVRIWMNNPLRYHGDSLFQHMVVGADTGTVLQVVRNPGRLIPYLSCVLITLGMLVHFGMRFRSALQKPAAPVAARRAGPAGVPAAVPPAGWAAGDGLVARVFPWAVLIVFAGWVGSQAAVPAPAGDGVDYYALGKLPVRDGGRVMPLDTLARTTLQSISNQSVVQDLEGTRVVTKASAMRWLVDVLDAAEWDEGPAAKYKVFRVENDQLLGKLDLPRRPGFYRYSLEELRPKLGALGKEFEAIKKKKDEGKPLDLYDAKVQELGRKLEQYQRLALAQDVQLVPPQSDGGDWTTFGQAEQAARAKISPTEEAEIRDRALAEFTATLERRFGSPDKLPEDVRSRVMTLARASVERELSDVARGRRGTVDPAAGALTGVLAAARAGKGTQAAAALAEYRDKYLTHVPAGEMRTVAVETYALDHLAPFYYAAFLYLFVIVFGLAGWLVWRRPVGRAAFLLAAFTFALHTAALAVRMWVMGRPPVTNLYASAVFIGWGAVGLCLILERLYRNGVGTVVGGAIGAATMYLAQFLGASGDTMAMLQAVLDTNLWLATHVVAVTLGYTATFVAGAVAVLYILRGVLTPSLDAATHKAFGSMIYGVLCFATLLSFVGTVLGGIWADYSWGRFWGWDPKENGAVLIVIWNALVLHARWCGLVKTRGMAVLAVFGNVVTAWSWFGTNQLSIGLHAYGFDDRLASGCMWFWLSQFVVMGVGMLPLSVWWSHRGAANGAAVAA